jgi:hypothetical protein
MRVFAPVFADSHQVHDGLRTAQRHARDRLQTTERDTRNALRTTGRHANALHGVLGWWAVTSFGLLSLLLAALAVFWPAPVEAFGAALVGSWLMLVALGRFGGAQLLRARYRGSRILQAGAALVALASMAVIQLPLVDATVAAASASLTLGVAAAVDAGAAAQFPRLARACLYVRAACGLVAAMAVAVAPVTGLIVAAACVGLGELMLAVRLLPEVERLTGMAERDNPRAAPDDDQWLVLPSGSSREPRPPLLP